MNFFFEYALQLVVIIEAHWVVLIFLWLILPGRESNPGCWDESSSFLPLYHLDSLNSGKCLRESFIWENWICEKLLASCPSLPLNVFYFTNFCTGHCHMLKLLSPVWVPHAHLNPFLSHVKLGPIQLAVYPFFTSFLFMYERKFWLWCLSKGRYTHPLCHNVLILIRNIRFNFLYQSGKYWCSNTKWQVSCQPWTSSLS